jgi:ribosome-binding protein aMBF1 (putative translation factor)
MNVRSYLQRAESIRKDELWPPAELARSIGIALNTWQRINQYPEKCALKTMRKLRKFVDTRTQHESKPNEPKPIEPKPICNHC